MEHSGWTIAGGMYYQMDPPGWAILGGSSRMDHLGWTALVDHPAWSIVDGQSQVGHLGVRHSEWEAVT